MHDRSVHRCIFCLLSDGGFQKKAHVIPESASNEDFVLPMGRECDRCNEQFSVIEQQIIRSLPGQMFRVAFVNKTTRGNNPTADIKGGKITRKDTSNGFEVRILRHSKNPHAVRDNIELEKSTVFGESRHALVGQKLSAFLAKIALEYFCLQGVDVYSTKYNHLRKCARSSDPTFFIPLFLGIHPHSTQNIRSLGGGETIAHKTRTIWVTFPGFAGIFPTARSVSQEDIRELKSFVEQNLPSQFLLISDPGWKKPVQFSMALMPGTEATRLQHRKL